MSISFLFNIENTIAIYSYCIPWALFPEFFVLISSHCRFDASDMEVSGLYISWDTLIEK